MAGRRPRRAEQERQRTRHLRCKLRRKPELDPPRFGARQRSWVYLADTSIVVAPSMSLAEEDIQFIKDHLGEWLAERSLGKPPAVYEIELRERMVRVEEELKHQRDLIKSILVEMDKRFDAVDKRFEAIDKRFEAMHLQMDKRFEDLTRRIDRFMLWSFGLTVSVGALIVAAVKLWP